MGVFNKSFDGYGVTVKNDIVYGSINGFYFNAVRIPAMREVRIMINYKSDDPEITPKIEQVFNNLKAQNPKLISITFGTYHLLITQGEQSAKKTAQLTELTVMQMTQFLAVRGCVTCCASCGEPQASFFNINGGVSCVCESCAQKVVGQFEQTRAATRQMKSKVVPGAVGAFLGALVGMVLWIVIYRLGYIAGIAGAVGIICSMKAYEKFGGWLDVKGIVISSVFSLVLIYIAHNIAITMIIVNEFEKYSIDYDFFDVYKNLPEFLELLEVKSQYWSDLIIGYVLTVIVGASYVIAAVRGAIGSYNMKRM